METVVSGSLLRTTSELSHEFGTPEFVKGGGGNTSCKNADTLWIKPSGTRLCDLRPESFVAVSREKLAEIHAIDPPADEREREARVKDLLVRSVRPGSSGRPSAETPVHEAFSATYVVHTHMVLGNGMTCAKDGAETCARLFPDALWMDYIDPGYTLCIEVRKAINAYADEKGREPSVVFLKNHGVFVAGDTPEVIRETHGRLVQTLETAYRDAGVPTKWEPGPDPDPEWTKGVLDTLQRIRELQCTSHARVSGPFKVAYGPLSPDHIVYAKTYPLVGEIREEAIREFCEQHGYCPLVYAAEEGVLCLGAHEAGANLVMDMATDGGEILQLTEAFGGVEFMDRRSAKFIENWEVEAYRRMVKNA